MNKDQKRRDEIVGLEKPKYVGGLEKFEGLTIDKLDLLVSEGFLDPTDAQNDAPIAQEFIDFMRQHEDLTAHGYVISVDRGDYRTTIEGLQYLGKPNDELKEAFFEFAGGADSIKIEDDELFAWWD